MGAATSIDAFQKLADDEKANMQLKYDDLIANGKSPDEAVAELMPANTEATEASTTTLTGTETMEKIPMTDLLEAVDRALAVNRTPLVVDRSEAGLVDTFFSYRSVQLLDAKKMGLDKSMKKVPVEEIMEEARKKLVTSMKLGMPLVIALQTAVTDFATTFNDEATATAEALKLESNMKCFPKEVFINGGRSLLEKENLDSLFREEDKEHGVAFSRKPEEFKVILTTRFAEEDFEEYLLGEEWGLPKPRDNYYYIIIEHVEGTPML